MRCRKQFGNSTHKNLFSSRLVIAVRIDATTIIDFSSTFALSDFPTTIACSMSATFIIIIIIIIIISACVSASNCYILVQKHRCCFRISCGVNPAHAGVVAA